MTRSVEIPEAAVARAAQKLREEGGEPGHGIHSWRCEHPDRYGACDCVEVTARAMLEAAALPYLAPAGEPLDFDSVELRDTVGAEVFRGLHGNGTVHFDTDVENNAMRDWTNYFVKSTLRALSAVTPAAPAVPQPAHCTCDPGPEGQHRYWCAIREAEVRALGVAPAAVPQPVDREALHDEISAAITKAVAEYRGYLVFDGLGTVAADAVLAVLAGEQEQVEP